MTDQEIFDELSAPFPAAYIDWRVGPTNKKSKKADEPLKGQPLAYVDARTVMDRLDTVCGPGGWQCNYAPGVGGSIVCNLGVHMEREWVWKADGAGATDTEGEKGALSDAFKRAAVRFGIARYLYDMKAGWIELGSRGDFVFIPEAERRKLDAFHDDFAKSAGWGERAGVQAYRLLKKVAEEFVTDAAAAQEFKDKNAAEIALLPVAMRKHLNNTLDRIGSNAREAA